MITSLRSKVSNFKLRHAISTSMLLATLGAGTLTASAFDAAAEAVDVELTLLVDSSGSINSSEFLLQRSGYAQAFRDPGVLDIISAHPNGIAVNMTYWSSAGEQLEAVPYMRITDPASAYAFADRIDAAERPFSGTTYINNAIDFGAASLANNQFNGRRWVMDISGDGTTTSDYNGLNTAAARNRALAGGVDTINGIVIGSDSVARFYTNNVAGGSGAFVQRVDTFDDFALGIQQKLGREITPNSPTNPVDRDPTLGDRPAASGQLMRYNGAGFVPVQPGSVATNQQSIVLTHGWNSSPGTFSDTSYNFGTSTPDTPLVQSLHQRFGPDVNILAWDWAQDSVSIWPGVAAWQTLPQGKKLGESLVSALGADYTQSVHFMGHSYGTLVNGEAIDTMQRGLANDINIQATLFDEASIGNLTSFGFDGGAGIFNWASPIADEADWTDNYISTVGQLHDEATNILLQRSITPNLVRMHRYPTDWYAYSVDFPSSSVLGSTVALANNGGLTQLEADTYYRQSLNPFDSDHELVKISKLQAQVLEIGRPGAVLASVGPLSIAETVADFGIDIVGEVIADFFVKQSAGGTPYFALEMTLVENSPAYAWVPIEIPDDADFMSFDFQFDGVGDEDFLTVGIEDSMLFAMEGVYLEDGVLYDSGMVDVSNWAGQQIEVFFGYNSDGITSGQMRIEDPQFYAMVPEPSSLAMLGLGGLLMVRRRRG